ncbi:MAG: DUF5696 domain-containing protein [Clostridia bacterium]|nr:DUF5696 domain-containing protein [Clostridia bacterium]
MRYSAYQSDQTGTRQTIKGITSAITGGERLIIPGNTLSADAKTLCVDLHGVIAEGNTPGYLVLPRSSLTGEYSLFRFETHTEDFSYSASGNNMPLYGVKCGDRAALVVVAGMSWDYTLKIERREGRLTAVIEVPAPLYEDLILDILYMSPENADYSGMARAYRAYQVEHTGMRLISERKNDFPASDYAASSPLIRIRCGWKPAPADVKHQTLDNEPPMHVACTFERIGEFLDTMKAEGIEKADVCLVGWNKSGHDGRWPDAFPVEPLLGGEDGLRRLINHAKGLGYSITCHTNHTDQYEIASSYSEDNTRRDYHGKPVENAVWSGGQMFDLCPKIGLAQAKELFPKVANLGFSGVHYVDVISIVLPRECTHPDHPVTRREACIYAKEMADAARDCFGGFSSEGVYEYLGPYIDYGLSARFNHNPAVCDDCIPFWEMVYHGYVLSNPYADTVNAVFKEKRLFLHTMEFGGRPTFYVYSAFMKNGRNWMTNAAIDPILDTDADMARTVGGLKESWEQMKEFGYLQYLTIDRHEILAPGVAETTYSDGTVVHVDYQTETFEIRKP